MRLRILLLFFLSLSAASALTPAPPPQPAADSTPIRAAAQKLLATGSPEDAAKAADLLEKAAQIDARNAETRKADAELRKLQQPDSASGNARLTTIATAATPLLTTIILAGTLIFQIYQARINEREKREDTAREQEVAEKKRFTDALELIQKSEDFSPAAALINTFTTEPYRTNIRKTAVTILLRSKTIDKFSDLFISVIDPVTHDSLPDVFEIMRFVDTSLNPLLNLTFAGDQNNTSSLTPAQLADLNMLVAQRDFLSARIAPVLRRPRPAGAAPFDLHNVGIANCDLTGANFRGAIISPGAWNYVNVDGCDFSGISQFKYCAFYTTAWWHAARMDHPLLQYLQANYPYAPRDNYNTLQPTSPEDYRDSLARLAASAT